MAVAGIAIGLFFFMRHRKQKAAEEEYKRNQVSDFMRHGGTSGEGKPPNTGYSNMSDQRLDPEAGRRNSAGSIADDQDYSRRILRVSDVILIEQQHTIANSSTRSPTPRKRFSFSPSPQAFPERSGLVSLREWTRAMVSPANNIQNKKPTPRKTQIKPTYLTTPTPQRGHPRASPSNEKRRDDSSTTVPKKEEPTLISFLLHQRPERPRSRCSAGRCRRGSTAFPCFSLPHSPWLFLLFVTELSTLPALAPSI